MRSLPSCSSTSSTVKDVAHALSALSAEKSSRRAGGACSSSRLAQRQTSLSESSKLHSKEARSSGSILECFLADWVLGRVRPSSNRNRSQAGATDGTVLRTSPWTPWRTLVAWRAFAADTFAAGFPLFFLFFFLGGPARSGGFPSLSSISTATSSWVLAASSAEVKRPRYVLAYLARNLPG